MTDGTTPLKATFFVLQKRDRAVLLPATIVFLLIVAAIAGAFVALNWSTLLGLGDLFARLLETPTPETANAEAATFIFRVFTLVGTAFLFMLPLYVAIAAYEAACLRWMIRGEAPGLFGLTINNDTWRVYGVYWVWFGVQLVVSMAFGIVLMPLMFSEMMEAARQGAADSEAIWRLQLRMQLLSLLQYVPLIFLFIRLGPAAATSVARRRFSFFEAWSASSDRFFALLGSYAIVTIPIVVIWGLIWVVAAYLQFGDRWWDMTAYWTGPPPTPEEARELARTAFTPRALAISLASTGAYLLAGLVWMLFIFGINARTVLLALDEGKIRVDSAD